MAAVLHLLGGVPRCGKTTVAHRVAARHGVGWLSTDTIRDVVNRHTGFMDEAGGIGVSHHAEAERFYPSFVVVARSCHYLSDRYLIEGVGFYPRHVVRLREEEGLEVRAVFVGMRRVDFGRVVEHAGRNRWHEGLDEATVAQIPGWLERWSVEVEEDCAAHGFPYVDMSDDFDAELDEVERLLFG